MAGRPTKLTDNFLKVTEKVINEDINAVIFTDEELFEEINDRLPEEEQVGLRTFNRWIAEKTEDINHFGKLIKRARRKQKRALIKSMDGNRLWTQKAWILERKFPEFNLKQLSETVHKVEPITINLNLNTDGKD